MAGLSLTLIEREWVDPLHVAAGLDGMEGRLILLSDGGRRRALVLCGG